MASSSYSAVETNDLISELDIEQSALLLEQFDGQVVGETAETNEGNAHGHDRRASMVLFVRQVDFDSATTEARKLRLEHDTTVRELNSCTTRLETLRNAQAKTQTKISMSSMGLSRLLLRLKLKRLQTEVRTQALLCNLYVNNQETLCDKLATIHRRIADMQAVIERQNAFIRECARRPSSAAATADVSEGDNEQCETEQTQRWACVICQHDMVLDNQVLALPCAHLFHLKCVQDWLKVRNVCPVCKRPASATTS